MTMTASTTLEDLMTRQCALCGRDIPDGEAAEADGQPLCHPDDPQQHDCYHLVTVFGYKPRPKPRPSGRGYVGAHRAQ